MKGYALYDLGYYPGIVEDDDETVKGEAGLKPSRTAYMSWGKGPKQRLRFSKYGTPRIEEMYSTHYIRQKDSKPE